MATMLMLVKSCFFVVTVMNSVMVVVCLIEKQYGCYHPIDSPCSNHTLTCLEDQRLRIAGMYYYKHSSTTTCPQDRCDTSPCCSRSNGDIAEPYTEQDSLAVYKACSIQQSCSITSPYSQTTGYNYIEYYYECEPKYYIHDIMTTEKISFRGGHFSLYYNGKDSPGQGLTCACHLSTGARRVRMQLLYIYLGGESCSRVTVTGDDKPLYTCSHDGVFISKTNDVFIKDIYRITFNNLTSSNDDVIWIEFTGRPENGSCDCKEQFEVRNGSWSSWSLFSVCSVSCGGGNKTRTRKCNNPAPANGGTNCSGKTTMYSRCNQQLCPVVKDDSRPTGNFTWNNQMSIGVGVGVLVLVILVFGITWLIRCKRNNNILTPDENQPTTVCTGKQNQPTVCTGKQNQPKVCTEKQTEEELAGYLQLCDAVSDQPKPKPKRYITFKRKK